MEIKSLRKCLLFAVFVTLTAAFLLASKHEADQHASSVYKVDRLAEDRNTTLGDLQKEADSFMYRMKFRMESRRTITKNVCRKLGLHQSIDALSGYQMYLKKYDTFFSGNPKTGITNWKKLFAKLDPDNVDPKISIHEVFRIVGDNKTAAIKEILRGRNVIKVTVVREPFHRLLSAFRNRLDWKPSSSDKRNLSTIIHEKYGTGTGLGKHGNYATFSDFIAYLVDQPELNTNVNEHWRSFQNLCQPCAVDYDVICHQETIDEDSKYFLKLIGSPDRVKLRGAYRNPTDDDVMREYYDDVRPRENLKKLFDILENDYTLFNYSKPDQLG